MPRKGHSEPAVSVKQLFADYRYKRIEIRRLKADKCTVTDSVQGSADEAPYTKRHITITGVDGTKKRINRERIERLEAECAYVEAAISLAPNSRLRVILEMRYIDGLEWADVARESGNADKSVDTVKKTAYAYLDMLEKERKAKAG